MPIDNKKIVTLAPKDSERNRPTKLINVRGEKLKSYNAGKYFYASEIEYNDADFHEIIKGLLSNSSEFITLGKLSN